MILLIPVGEHTGRGRRLHQPFPLQDIVLMPEEYHLFLKKQENIYLSAYFHLPAQG